MTDDEIRILLKPKHNWVAILGVLAGVAGTAWGIARWAATVPTGEDFKQATNRAWEMQLKIDHTADKVDRLQNDVSDVKSTVNEIRVNVGSLKEIRRNRGGDVR